MSPRRDLFGFLRPKSPITLPYVKNSTELCKDCEGQCVSACERGIVFKKEGGVAYLDFAKTGCVFCKECAFVCEKEGKGVLSSAMEDKIIGKAKIDIASCLSYHHIICQSCKDVCKNAIKFSGMFYPEVLDSCTACGLCVSICPQKSISII